MKRFPAFVLASVLAISLILPVSAIDLVSLIDSAPLAYQHSIVVNHSNGNSTLYDFDSDVMALASLSSCYFVYKAGTGSGGTYVPISSSLIDNYSNMYLTSGPGSSTYFRLGIAVPASAGDIIVINNLAISSHNSASKMGTLTSLPSGTGPSGSWGSYSLGSNTNTSYAIFFSDTPTPTYSTITNNGQGTISSSGTLSAGNYQIQYSVPSSFSNSYVLFWEASYTTGSNVNDGYRMGFIWNEPSINPADWIPELVSSLPSFALESTLQSLLGTANDWLAKDSTLQSILSKMNSIESAVSGLTPMQQFENDYLENFEGQISQAESAISSSNPALPNGGDVGGFVSGLQDGLGVSGDSFSMSDFNNAVGSFSGSASTSEDGPWWFFSEEVAQDMSGDVSTFDLDDSWFWSFYDDFERRLKNHGIGSVGS